MKYSLKDIRSTLEPGQPWCSYVLFEPSVWLTWIFANLGISPNFVTFLSLLAFLTGAFYFYKGAFVIGGLFCLLREILDFCDGNIARVSDKSTRFGALVDRYSAYIGTMACLIALFMLRDMKFLYLLMPFLVLMIVIYPLNRMIMIFLIKKPVSRPLLPILDFVDTRVLGIMVLPIIYPLISHLNITYKTAIIMTIILTIIKQVDWLRYNHKELKHAVLTIPTLIKRYKRE